MISVAQKVGVMHKDFIAISFQVCVRLWTSCINVVSLKIRFKSFSTVVEGTGVFSYVCIHLFNTFPLCSTVLSPFHPPIELQIMTGFLPLSVIFNVFFFFCCSAVK